MEAVLRTATAPRVPREGKRGCCDHLVKTWVLHVEPRHSQGKHLGSIVHDDTERYFPGPPRPRSHLRQRIIRSRASFPYSSPKIKNTRIAPPSLEGVGSVLSTSSPLSSRLPLRNPSLPLRSADTRPPGAADLSCEFARRDLSSI
ncbi:hypothetical protein B296_00023314 [Ensete ventricosum]|uniref:Uncharacterized protein n=1 Tax=Ensete ventricosum TaxID=4639 RepID=A0A427A6A8_ENSVE|nr:hypothetical protein B296_00023314 [Ensete ventricosum]